MMIPSPQKIHLDQQSGANRSAILDWLITQNLGLSKFVSLGNRLYFRKRLPAILEDYPKTKSS
jgi:acyl-CoA synthetase (NDP forming)